MMLSYELFTNDSRSEYEFTSSVRIGIIIGSLLPSFVPLSDGRNEEELVPGPMINMNKNCEFQIIYMNYSYRL